MSWKKIKNIAKRVLTPGHMSRKQFKSVRKKLGLTSKNKLVRSVRRSFFGSNNGDVLGGSVPTSAGNFQSRSISQLMGGV